MVALTVTLRNPTSYVFTADTTVADVRTIAGGGGGGNGSALFGGGGGGGGAYAATPNVALTVGSKYIIGVGDSVPANNPGDPSKFSTASTTQTAAPPRSLTLNHPVGTNQTADNAVAASIILEPTVADGDVTLFSGTGMAIRTSPGDTTYPSLSLPAGLQVGDVIVASAVTIVAALLPAGWTQVNRFNPNFLIATRVVTSAAESGTKPLWQTDGKAYDVSYAVYRGSKAPINDTIGTFVGANFATVNFPRLTTPRALKAVRAFVFTAIWGTETNYRYDSPPQMVEAWDVSFDNITMYQAYEVMPPAPATALVLAAAGAVGGAGTTLAGGTAGAGGTTAASTGTTKVAGSTGGAGTASAGGVGGAGAASGTTPTGGAANNPPGGGGTGGGILSAAGLVGQRGIAVIAYDTGSPTITHTATMTRRATLTRASAATITHVASVVRSTVLARAFAAGITHVASVSKRIGLTRTATITHTAAITRKAISLARSANITHTPAVRKAITLATKTATITHTAIFARSVTLRRSFAAGITHTARLLLTLEGRLIPRGGVVANTIRSIFIFDD